jgi:hypothetical protein
MPRPHIEPFSDRDVDFKPLNLPGFGRGIHFKMLSLDEQTGACSMTVQFDAGYEQPASVAYSDVEIMLFQGSLQVGDKQVNEGHYFFIPKGVQMPAISANKQATALLMFNDCEPHWQPAETDLDGAEREKLVSINSYRDMPWEVPTLFPRTASGCLIKILYFNHDTWAMSFLYVMSPAFLQENISYHDCAEEGYHIWGDSWMMQFGELPTGGYFYRPAYINHGSFKTENGVLGFARTDGELHNHFHWNPYSTPEENADRSAAKLIRHKPELNRWLFVRDHNHIDFEHPGEIYTPESLPQNIHTNLDSNLPKRNSD